MNRIANDLLQFLAGYLPEGFYAWATECRPDVARYVGEAGSAVQVAASAGDKEEFAAAVECCAAMYLQAVDVYEKDGKRVRRLTYGGVSRGCGEAGIN